MRDFLKTYGFLHRNRASWYHLRWRIFAITVAIIAIMLIYNYVTTKYFVVVPEYGFLLGEKFFYWYMIGFISGAIVLALMFEGEFLLGVRHLSSEMKHEEFVKSLTEEQKPKKATIKSRKRH